MKTETRKILCQNKKARHEYDILDSIEAGIVLTGPEVKSLRSGGGNLKDGYAGIDGSEMHLYNVHISPYAQANIHNTDPVRARKLLLHRNEIAKLSGKVKEKGLTLIPLSLYLKGSLIKVELGLAKGRHTYDKKQVIKERDIKRDMDREIKSWE
ncbi:MAG: SsrA-binding protein SmpB [Thermodesulfobacteriota bacterium]|nr:SsrA-binding protein SmpB [Thermodesulfobacteriota bacterium]